MFIQPNLMGGKIKKEQL
ncbi:Putative uncharacterized protein [Lactococcus lactis subsp. lactis A12]|uniref:Uncharacterized protein n=1 Tax=Lactococcus lactis subsp. lactis A12 TaxID=1137134 RepID=S6FVA9_LACLL|nr:Putative uncharacterized protein [Lactococcus lactis subsp. lactis A12]SBW31722.1 Hypothetical protein LLA12_02598 [Lactococcus lactis subsp. lactis]